MSYVIKAFEKITIPKCSDNPVINEFLSNYTYGKKWDIEYSSVENCITTGNFTKADCLDGEYVLNVTDDGVYISGVDHSATMRGFIAFLEKLCYDDSSDSFYIENCCEYGKPLTKFRCAHLCVFYETDLQFFKKCVRACAIAKYTHIIIEFWGMLKFDCMKELAWETAYSKETIRELVREVNALGVEVIPMFNHVGHASMCRASNGQHVVLDQNPKYEYMFEGYGWVWNFEREDVKQLHKKIREELIEVCGEGEYFHIGCDEVHSYSKNEENARKMVEYVNSIASELKEKGRKVIMWHDMMLPTQKYWFEEGKYFANSSDKVADILINGIDKDIIIADWQYNCHDEEWKSSKVLKEKGFEVMCCPWEDRKNSREALDTVIKNNLYGVIYTTWHTLSKGVVSLIYSGKILYGVENLEEFDAIVPFYTAEVIRKAMPSNGDYEKSGWTKKMTDM